MTQKLRLQKGQTYCEDRDATLAILGAHTKDQHYLAPEN